MVTWQLSPSSSSLLQEGGGNCWEIWNPVCHTYSSIFSERKISSALRKAVSHLTLLHVSETYLHQLYRPVPTSPSNCINSTILYYSPLQTLSTLPSCTTPFELHQPCPPVPPNSRSVPAPPSCTSPPSPSCTNPTSLQPSRPVGKVSPHLKLYNHLWRMCWCLATCRVTNQNVINWHVTTRCLAMRPLFCRTRNQVLKLLPGTIWSRSSSNTTFTSSLPNCCGSPFQKTLAECFRCQAFHGHVHWSSPAGSVMEEAVLSCWGMFSHQVPF